MSDAIGPNDIFTCRRCGDCCRGYGGTFVTDGDIASISRFLHMTSTRFVVEFCQMSGGRPMLAQSSSGYCIFWNKLCTIHPVKPQMCKKWPFIEHVLVDIANWKVMASFCPGIRTDIPDQLIKECVKRAPSTRSEFCIP
jgi:Fe-S-cluster containining protein